MKTVKVSVVTPDGPVRETDATMIIAAAESGEIGILPGHISTVAPLRIAPLRIISGDKQEVIAVHGGFIEVRPDVVTILAQTAETADGIDIDRAKAAAKRAEEALRAKQDDDVDRAIHELALKRADNRINVHQMGQ